MKKFYNYALRITHCALLIAALLLATTPAQAQKPVQNVWNEGFLSIESNDSVEKFYDSLPKAKGEYKSRQRPILIEGAMNSETEILVRALKNPVAYRELNYLFVAGTYKNYPVVVVRTEQGFANAAASTALAIKKFNPCAVINQGTAGGYLPSLHVGDIVICEKSIPTAAFKSAYSAKGAGIDFTQQEMRGTYAFDEATGNFQPYSEHPADKTLLDTAKKIAAAHKEFNVATGAISSADWWLSWIDFISLLNERHGVICEEMETDAAAQICQTAGVPFIGIRVISNNIVIGKDYIPESAINAQNFVLLVAENYISDILKM